MEICRSGFRGGERLAMRVLLSRMVGIRLGSVALFIGFLNDISLSEDSPSLKVPFRESSHSSSSGSLSGRLGSLRLEEVPSSFQANLLEANCIVGMDEWLKLLRRRIAAGAGLCLIGIVLLLSELLSIDFDGRKVPSNEHLISDSPLL